MFMQRDISLRSIQLLSVGGWFGVDNLSILCARIVILLFGARQQKSSPCQFQNQIQI